jgi:hypothetical protein
LLGDGFYPISFIDVDVPFRLGTIVCRAEPADFDADGYDVDTLVGEIVSGNDNLHLDLSGNGVVNAADLEQWLAEAATENGIAATYSAA